MPTDGAVRTRAKWGVAVGIAVAIVIGIAVVWLRRSPEMPSVTPAPPETRATRATPAPPGPPATPAPAATRVTTTSHRPLRAGSNASRRTSQIDSGLDWLRDQQEPDGRWRDPGTTGMALLTFLGSGETHQSGSYRDVVKSAWRFLSSGQDAEGCLVPRTSPRLLRDHALAALALSEAYGMTGSAQLKAPAQNAVRFALATRTPGGAWNFPAPDDGEIDVEATAWMSHLLQVALQAELGADRAALGEITAAFDRITDPATSRLRASPRVTATISADAASAVALLVRIRSGRGPDIDAASAKVEEALLANPPAAGMDDLPYAYFSSCAMLGIGGARFRAWQPGLDAFVTTAARDDGPEKGSWDPPPGWPEDERIRATAYHLLCREFYYGAVGHAGMRR